MFESVWVYVYVLGAFVAVVVRRRNIVGVSQIFGGLEGRGSGSTFSCCLGLK